MSAHRLVELGVEEVDRVAPLFKQLVGFHGDVVAGAWPVRDEEEAWRRRRAQYVEWLAAAAVMLAAVAASDPDATPDGYAVLGVKRSMASWEVGERIGELETLAVAAQVRGRGIGTMLLDACRERLRAEGVSHWTVAVVEANEDATRLYERVGFRPFYRQLLAET